MMMAGDKNRIIAMVVSRLHSNSGLDADGNRKAYDELAANPEGESEDGLSSVQKAMSEEMVNALHAKDASSFGVALHAFIEHCLVEYEQEEDEEEQEPSEHGILK